jgi:hypothetical protein
MADNEVGAFSVLAPANRDSCENCQRQESSQAVVAGTIDLTEALLKHFHDLPDDKTVAEFLKEKLAWRVAQVGFPCMPFSTFGN